MPRTATKVLATLGFLVGIAHQTPGGAMAMCMAVPFAVTAGAALVFGVDRGAPMGRDSGRRVLVVRPAADGVSASGIWLVQPGTAPLRTGAGRASEPADDPVPGRQRQASD